MLAQPRHRDAHQTSSPNGTVKRTSPSTMSRMSSTPCRNISVRSMPIPKAKPEYMSGSIPQAISTFGLTMPQPPHSIHPSDEQVRQGRSGLPTDSPRQTKQRRSSSALGSVNGKYDGRSRVSDALAEHRRREVVESALEVGHGDAPVDHQALDLAEDGCVSRVELVGAERATRADDVDRRLLGEHGAHLNRRGVRAQHDSGVGRVDEERVGHVARPGAPGAC